MSPSPLKIPLMYNVTFRDHFCIKYCRFWLMTLILLIFGVLCLFMIPKILYRRPLLEFGRTEYGARVQPYKGDDFGSSSPEFDMKVLKQEVNKVDRALQNKMPEYLQKLDSQARKEFAGNWMPAVGERNPKQKLEQDNQAQDGADELPKKSHGFGRHMKLKNKPASSADEIDQSLANQIANEAQHLPPNILDYPHHEHDRDVTLERKLKKSHRHHRKNRRGKGHNKKHGHGGHGHGKKNDYYSDDIMMPQNFAEMPQQTVTMGNKKVEEMTTILARVHEDKKVEPAPVVLPNDAEEVPPNVIPELQKLEPVKPVETVIAKKADVVIEARKPPVNQRPFITKKSKIIEKIITAPPAPKKVEKPVPVPVQIEENQPAIPSTNKNKLENRENLRKKLEEKINNNGNKIGDHDDGGDLHLDVEIDREDVEEMSKLFTRKLDAQQHDELVEAIRTAHQLLRKAGVTYFLHGRSLLGYYRHAKSMIPWDDKAEIAILASDSASRNSPYDYYLQLLKKQVEAYYSDWTLEKSPDAWRTLLFRKKAPVEHERGDNEHDADHSIWRPTVRIAVLQVKSAKTMKPIFDFLTKPPGPKQAFVQFDDKTSDSYQYEDVMPLEPATFETNVETLVPKKIEPVLRAIYHDLAMCEVQPIFDAAEETAHDMRVQIECSQLAHLFPMTNIGNNAVLKPPKPHQPQHQKN